NGVSDPQVVLVTGIVTGFIFQDLDNDGIFNNSDKAFPAVEVDITDVQNQPIKTFTGADGKFSISVLAGQATVQAVTPSGYNLTTNYASQTVTVPPGGSVSLDGSLSS